MRARRRSGRGAALAVVVALAGATALVGCAGDDPSPEAEAPASEAVPPAVDRTAAHLWLSAEQVPPEGGDLAVVLVDPGRSGDTWGVAADVDRWDGAGWERLDRARVCMDFWDCVGQIGGVDAVEDIGLTAAPVGPLTWLRTGALDPGWYRLTQTSDEGTVAAGRFEVRAGAEAVPMADADSVREGDARLVVEPTVLFASDALRAAEAEYPVLQVSTSVPTDLSSERVIAVRASADAGAAPRAWQDGRIRIERWDGERWIDASELQLGGMSPGIGADDPILFTFDDPPPGAYRIVVLTEAATLEGRFWVTDLE